MSKPSPFNGRWALNYSSDFEDYMDAYEMDEAYRKVVREALTNFSDSRLYEEYFIDNAAGLISRKVVYGNEPGRESSNVKFETIHTSKYFDLTPVKYMYGREGGSDNKIVRFEIGNKDKVHTMIVTEVHDNTMLSTYTCRGKTYLKKFDKVA